MKNILFIVLVFISASAFAQSDASYMDSCHFTMPSDRNDPDLEKKYEIEFDRFCKCVIGKKFVDFKVTTMNGTVVDSKDLKNKVVFINTWFIGCPPCEAETPMLNSIYNEFKGKDFVMLSFSCSDTKHIQAFLPEHKMDFPIISSARDIIEGTFKLPFGYPTNIILNKKGEFAMIRAGGPMENDLLRQFENDYKKVIKEELAKQL